MLDDDVDLGSPLLCSMLSGERPSSNFNGTMAPPITTTCGEMRNPEPTEEEWENM